MDFSSMCTNWLSVLFPPLTCIDYCTQSTKWSRKLQKMVPRTPVLSANFWHKWIPVVNLLQRTSLAKGRPVFCLEKIIFTVMQKRWHMRRQLCFWIVPPEMASEEKTQSVCHSHYGLHEKVLPVYRKMSDLGRSLSENLLSNSWHVLGNSLQPCHEFLPALRWHGAEIGLPSQLLFVRTRSLSFPSSILFLYSPFQYMTL